MFTFFLFLLLLLAVIYFLFTYVNKEHFGGSDFWHYGALRNTADQVEEDKKRADALTETEEDMNEHFTDVDPIKKEDKNDKGTAPTENTFNPSEYVLSDYPTSQELGFNNSVVDYSAPEIHYFERGNYTDLTDLKTYQDKKEMTDLNSAFGEVESDIFYKSIELYKSRGGNRI